MSMGNKEERKAKRKVMKNAKKWLLQVGVGGN
jgi:hypothetical protein